MSLFCIGSYSSKGITCLNFKDGIFEQSSILSDFADCSYITKNKNFLYSVIESSCRVVSYKQKGNSFSFLNTSSSFGDSPCYLTVDKVNNILYVANYEGGSFCAFQLNSDGKIGDKLYFEKFEDNISHIHFIALSSDNNYLFVIDLGADKIYAYKICKKPHFSLSLCDTFCFPSNTGPRHLVFDNYHHLHVIAENSCEIYTLSFHEEAFSFLFKTSLFHNSLKKELNDTGCAIKINKNFLYATLRGKNLICVFEIFENKLNFVQSISCNGSTPRDISFDNTCQYLICANQSSNNLSVFSISVNDNTNHLTFKNTFSISNPSCILPI